MAKLLTIELYWKILFGISIKDIASDCVNTHIYLG